MKRYYCKGLGHVAPDVNTCCHQHDRDYGVRGTVTRAEADRRLRQCLLAQGKPLRAWLFWLGCRLVGWYFWKEKKHD